MGYHPSVCGNTRFSAWPQRPLPDASRGRGALTGVGAFTTERLYPKRKEEPKAPTRDARINEQDQSWERRAKHVRGGQSALGGHSQGPAGGLSSSLGRIPKVRIPAVQEGLPAWTGPGGRGQSREFGLPSVPPHRRPSHRHTTAPFVELQEICATRPNVLSQVLLAATTL